MKRLAIVTALLWCAGAGLSAGQQAAAEAPSTDRVFIGWVDVNLNDWVTLGYENAADWADVVEQNNIRFQDVCRAKLPGRELTGAKNRTDENAAGHTWHVKFSNVKFDTDSYRLYLSVHVVNPRSGEELAMIPVRAYRGGRFTVYNCLQGALEKVADTVRLEVLKVTRK